MATTGPVCGVAVAPKGVPGVEQLLTDTYTGQSTVSLRFVGTSGSSWQGDLCVDNVGLSGAGGSGGAQEQTLP